ncbi:MULTISPECIES: hypothetical protein [unclassified Variovorax]|uniref:hypothetical protein n=1 Tax=unclassified Variovorax TaxID=663243 RepID=UPI001BD1D8B6|nr:MULTISPECIES: hypothetical protein [unclassified Variovorax]
MSPSTNSEIETSRSGVCRDMSSLVLRAMKAAGLIEPTAKGRSTRWPNRNTADPKELHG